MIRWIFYPKSSKPTAFVISVVQAFESVSTEIDSENHDLSSNEVLARGSGLLHALRFAVEQVKGILILGY